MYFIPWSYPDPCATLQDGKSENLKEHCTNQYLGIRNTEGLSMTCCRIGSLHPRGYRGDEETIKPDPESWLLGGVQVLCHLISRVQTDRMSELLLWHISLSTNCHFGHNNKWKNCILLIRKKIEYVRCEGLHPTEEELQYFTRFSTDNLISNPVSHHQTPQSEESGRVHH